jgi:hypothetical protein
MPGQKASGGTGLRICPPPPKGFDPFTASKVDLARHGLPLRPDPQTQPDLAALWDRLADRYRDFEHLEPRPDTAAARKKAAEKAVAPRVLPLDPPGVVRLQPLRIPSGAVHRPVRHLDSARPAIQSRPVRA